MNITSTFEMSLLVELITIRFCERLVISGQMQDCHVNLGSTRMKTVGINNIQEDFAFLVGGIVYHCALIRADFSVVIGFSSSCD
jgi:hypothetical protein